MKVVKVGGVSGVEVEDISSVKVAQLGNSFREGNFGQMLAKSLSIVNAWILFIIWISEYLGMNRLIIWIANLYIPLFLRKYQPTSTRVCLSSSNPF